MTTFSAQTVSDISGLSPRQVARLAEFGCFGEDNRWPGSGGRRRFSPADLTVAAVLGHLSDYGGVLAGNGPALSVSFAVEVAAAVRSAGPLRWLTVSSTGAVSCAADETLAVSGASLIVDLLAIEGAAMESLGANA